MEQVIRRPAYLRLLEVSLISWFKRARRQRPVPRNQADIDRLPKGWERKSESTRAKMARLEI